MLARYRPLRGPKRLGDRLLEAGLITRTQLDAALDQQAGGRDPHCHLGRVLVDLGFLTDRDLLQMLGVAPIYGRLLTPTDDQPNAYVFEETGMLGHDVDVDVGLGLQQRGRRHDEADGLQVAEPLLVCQDLGET